MRRCFAASLVATVVLLCVSFSFVRSAEPVAKAGASSQARSGNVWPAPAVRIEYLSKADNTLQPAYCYLPKTEKAVPLVVGLHTWSGDYRQLNRYFLDYAVKNGWAFIHPDFRGPNWTPAACGSDQAVEDVVSAVEYVESRCKIDTNRVYLMGSSGGGYLAMLMAGRHPEIWAGVCCWVGISDLAAWHEQTASQKLSYSTHLEEVCGGVPGASPEIDAQYKHRSALTWAENARSVPLNINHGIHDGHRKSSVPVSQSLRFYNRLVPESARLAEAQIAYIVKEEKIPESLAAEAEPDPGYGAKRVLFRRRAGNARITVFEGGHTAVALAGLDWLARQTKGKPADWSVSPVSADAKQEAVQK